jgi:hypothetical protein
MNLPEGEQAKTSRRRFLTSPLGVIRILVAFNVVGNTISLLVKTID